MAATVVATLLGAAAEQCALRTGTEITLLDIARAVTLAAPELAPIEVEVQTIDRVTIATDCVRTMPSASST